jgi:transcriptional regulator with XRE-family HTH domain
MKFQDIHHDEAMLAELGLRLAQLRIQLNMTQAELARKAGIGKRTLERLEAGETTQTRTLLRILRELDLLEKLEMLLPEPTARPSQAIKQLETLPKRVAKKRPNSTNPKEWKWGDET